MLSPALVSKITDVVANEITGWQNRPVDEVLQPERTRRAVRVLGTQHQGRDQLAPLDEFHDTSLVGLGQLPS